MARFGSVLTWTVAVVLLASACHAQRCTEVTQSRKFVPFDNPRRGFVGSFVAISPDTVVASGFGVSGYAGAVYTYDLVDGAWQFGQKITPSDSRRGDHFGWESAIRDNRLVVGAVFKRTSAGRKAGKAYIFERPGPGGTWSQVATLEAPDAEPNDHFGYSVMLNRRGYVFIGCEQGGKDPSSTKKNGAVYIYLRQEDGTYDLVQIVRGEQPYDEFGDDLSFGSGRLVVGAPFAESSSVAANSGAAYVYRRGGGAGLWQRIAKFTMPTGSATGDNYGTACSIAPNGKTIVVGADRGPGSVSSDQGSAYVYMEINGSWTLTQTLLASDAKRQDRFGYRSSIIGGTLFLSAWATDDFARDSGSFYIFHWNGQRYVENKKVLSPTGREDDRFGLIVATTGKWMVTSNSREDSDAPASSREDTSFDDGAIYIYSINRNPEHSLFFNPRPAFVPTTGTLTVRFKICTDSLSNTVSLGILVPGANSVLFRTERPIRRLQENGSLSLSVSGLTRGETYMCVIHLRDAGGSSLRMTATRITAN